jgi:tetratricopeptide (TPR) repeat protein
MRVAQRASRTHQVLAIFLSGFVAIGSIPSTAYAAPPPKPAAAGKKPPAKPGKPDEDPKRAEARKKYAEGETKFQAGDYEGAYAAYKAANEAVPASQALYKMAVCLDKLDKSSEAAAAYGAFLASNPPPAMEAKATEAQARVAELRRKIPIVVKVVSDPSGASVYLDGVVQMGTTPLEIKAPPGKHKVRVTSPGYETFEKDLDLEPGGSDVTVDAV